jgi:hypothetical protein
MNFKLKLTHLGYLHQKYYTRGAQNTHMHPVLVTAPEADGRIHFCTLLNQALGGSTS